MMQPIPYPARTVAARADPQRRISAVEGFRTTQPPSRVRIDPVVDAARHARRRTRMAAAILQRAYEVRDAKMFIGPATLTRLIGRNSTALTQRHTRARCVFLATNQHESGFSASVVRMEQCATLQTAVTNASVATPGLVPSVLLGLEIALRIRRTFCERERVVSDAYRA